MREITGIQLDSLTLSNSSIRHPMLFMPGLLYIASGNKIDIIDTTNSPWSPTAQSPVSVQQMDTIT